MPCPSSHLPVYAVIVPSPDTAIHESSRPGSTCDARVSNCPCAKISSVSEASPLKATMSAPEVLRKSRREKTLTSHLLCVAADGGHHPGVREASAQDARHGLPDLGLAGFR